MARGGVGAGWRMERGSVLMLVPAAVLVLFVLGSIAVDSSIAFMGQRELTSAAAAAANDAAGAAVSDQAFYRGTGDLPGQVVLDEAAARTVALAAFDRRSTRGVTVDGVPDVRVTMDRVCVTVTGHVDYIFARAVPGASRGHQVTGRAVATAVQGDDQGRILVQAGGAC